MKIIDPIILNMDDEIDKANKYASNYVRTHVGEIRAEYGTVIILAIQEEKGIVGWDKNLERLVKSTQKKQEGAGTVVFGRINDFLKNERMWGYSIK